MSGMLYNPGLEQRAVIVTDTGFAYSTTSYGGPSRENRGVEIDMLLREGWQVASVTPGKDKTTAYFFLVLERRIRNAQSEQDQ